MRLYISLKLTLDDVNKFYDVLHRIDNSLDNILDSIGKVASLLEAIRNNLNNLNPKED